MLATSPGYQDMIAGHTLTTSPVRIQVTLPGDGLTDVSATVTTAKISASTTTDQPDGVRFEVGYPAMQLTFTVADVAELFAPYNTASPLYRQSALNSPVTADWGTPTGTAGAVEWLRKFTGTVDSYVCNSDGSVSFTCVDNRSLLRSSATLPAVVTATPYNAGLTSEFGVDYLLRRSTNGQYSSWPAQRSNCLLAVGFRSSLWPEVGTFPQNNSTTPPRFVPGAHGSALQQLFPTTEWSSNALSYNTTSANSDYLFVEFWTGALVSGGSTTYLDVQPSSNTGFQPTVGVRGGPGGYAYASIAGGAGLSVNAPQTWDGQPHYIAALFHQAIGDTAWHTTLWVDDTQYVGAGSTAGARPSGGIATVRVITDLSSGDTVDHVPFIEALQVTTESSPTVNATFSPQAVLDPSLNPLQMIPTVDSDPWQTIQQIADAEQAVAGFDESGVFRFRNRDTLRSSAAVRTVTSDVSLKDLDIELQSSSVYNRVQVPYQGWVFGAATTAYTFSNVLKVLAHSTQSFPVTTASLVAQVDGTVSKLPNTHYPLAGGDVGQSWFRASSDRAGVNEHPGVTVTAAQTDPSTITVTVVNNTNLTAWFVSPANYTDLAAGSPSLWIGGIPVTQGDALTADTGPSGTDDVTYQASSNPWLQDQDAATQLAQRLLSDMSKVRPQLTNVSIVPDPSLQLTDRIILEDPYVTGINEHATLWGWDLTMAPGGDDMTVDARAVASPGQWILGVAGRTELAVNTYI